jgi:hypothetical protein
MNRADIEAANQTIAREVAECLNIHYPCHAWAVTANVETGLVEVYNLKLSGKWGFIIKIDDMATDPGLRLVIHAGGELLERFNVKRGELTASVEDAILYDFKGEAIRYD